MASPQGYLWSERSSQLWSEERTDAMTQVTFTAEAEPYSVILSEFHKSLYLIVKARDLVKKMETTTLGLTPQVKAENVTAMSGICVDDYLTVGPPKVVDAFVTTLRKLWKTSEPQYLSFTQNLTFLGVTTEKKEDGLLLHQHNYIEDLLKEHAAPLPAQLEREPPLAIRSTFRKCLLLRLIPPILSTRSESREDKGF